MIGLLITVCSIASPAQCEVHRQTLPGSNELTCLMTGQAEAARALRPGWRVTRFGCARMEALAQEDAPLPVAAGMAAAQPDQRLD